MNLKTRFPNIELHEFVVMPNHFHGILEIVGASLVGAPNAQNDENAPTEEKGQSQGVAPTDENAPTEEKGQGVAPTGSPTIGDMMDAFKSITTVEYIRGVKNLGWPRFDGKLWQRNYYEHIIRNDNAYLNISKYIINNPGKWGEDKFHND